MNNRPSVRKLRERNSSAAGRIRDMARRLSVKITGEFWQLLGYNDGTNDEVFDEIEAFQNVGFSSRPKAGNEAEVIVLNLGESSHPVIVATRDKAIEITLAEDETAIFNSTGAKCLIKADGTVEIDDGSGAVSLATKADVQGVVDAITNGVPGSADGGAALQTSIVGFLSGFPAGTTVLKGK